jgi:hypothetical protein
MEWVAEGRRNEVDTHISKPENSSHVMNNQLAINNKDSGSALE